MERFEHGGNVYQAAPAGGWLDFSANINPLGLSVKVYQALREHLGDVIHYPDPQAHDLRRALAKGYGVESSQLVLGNGAAELFYLYMHTFRPQRVVLAVPCFNEYERAARAVGAAVEYVALSPTDNFSFPWEKLAEKCAPGTCLILGNPNNPTGTLAQREPLLRLLAVAKERGSELLIDESFLDFLPGEKAYSLLDVAAAWDNLFLVRSLTKFYALPGLRLGFALTTPARCQRLEAHKDGWNVNLLAQVAGVAALTDEAYQQEARQLVAREKVWLAGKLDQLPGIHVFPPAVNFLLWRLKGAEKVVQELREKGILVRACDNFPGLSPAYIRTAVRTHDENLKLLTALNLIL